MSTDELEKLHIISRMSIRKERGTFFMLKGMYTYSTYMSVMWTWIKVCGNVDKKKVTQSAFSDKTRVFRIPYHLANYYLKRSVICHFQ